MPTADFGHGGVAGVTAITKIRRIVILDWTSRPRHALLDAGGALIAVAVTGVITAQDGRCSHGEFTFDWQLFSAAMQSAPRRGDFIRIGGDLWRHLSNFPHVLDYKDSANTWFTPYYFSIVTYTTLGLLLSVLAQSIARRS